MKLSADRPDTDPEASARAREGHKTHKVELNISSTTSVSLAGVAFKGTLSEWFKGFFSGRSQMTTERDSKPDTFTVTNVGGLTVAHSYLGDAENYLAAAKQLNPDVGQFSSPKYFLLCHAIELALKAYILASGGTERELKKREIRHALENLWIRATELGLRSTNDKLSKIIEQVGPAHEDHSFRYNPDTWTHLLPPADPFEAAVSDLISDVTVKVDHLSILRIT